MEQQTGSKSGKEYIKAVYCHPAYITSLHSTSYEMLDKAQAGIKIAGRNINNLRYADDTTLMAEEPLIESEKGKGSRSVVSDSLRPYGLQRTRLLCPWDLPAKSTGVGCHLTCW